MFDDRFLWLVGLAKFELPGHTLRLCDGGQVIWGAEVFRSSDDDFGTIAEVVPFAEESGDDAPSGRITFLPVSTAAAATLSQPEYQGARMRFWLAQVDPETGVVDGTPEQVADMELDTTELRVARGDRRLEIGMMASAERLFNINEGNVLSPRFHASVWAGEQGLDNATGVPLTKAWGVKVGPRGTLSGGFAGPSASAPGGSLGNEFLRA